MVVTWRVIQNGEGILLESVEPRFHIEQIVFADSISSRISVLLIGLHDIYIRNLKEQIGNCMQA